MKTAALIIFIVMYAVMIIKPDWRAWAALAASAVYGAMGLLAPHEILTAIDWNILMMLFGTMITVGYFIRSRMPNRIADHLLDLAPNVMWVTIFISLFSGVISALIDNVSTVLMVAPVGLAVCRKLKVNPVPVVISIAVSSNLQGAATLIGDTTSMMLAAYAHMDFMDFFWMNGKPGIFFAVELGAVATVPLMMFLFRKEKTPVQADEYTNVTSLVPTFVLLAQIGCLIAASFLPDKPGLTNGIICVAGALICMMWEGIFQESRGVLGTLRGVDYQTLLLLAGLFLVVAGITNAGIIGDLADIIARVGGTNVFLLYTIVVWGSVAISAFIDNIPYVATMLPVLQTLTETSGADPSLLYFGLLIGATLGGNMTPVGASANIAGVGMLRQRGYEVSFREFGRIGISFTLTAVTVGYVFLWLVLGR